MPNLCTNGTPAWLTQAVRDVLAQIKAGAWPLKMDPKHEAALHAEFEDKFCRNLQSKADWEQNHRKRVLKVARLHGAYAASFTILDGVATNGTIPNTLDPYLTGVAGKLAQKLHCPDLLLGVPCTSVAFVTDEMRAELPAPHLRLLEWVESGSDEKPG